jgi:hypothetical protein
MKLTTRIERLERQAGIGEPLKLTIAFFDSILDGTISDEEFARYAHTLREILSPADSVQRAGRGDETVTMKAIIRRLRRLEEDRVVRKRDEGPNLAEVIRERRRRRAEACGEPFEVRPCKVIYDQDWPISVADVLRSGRRRVAASTEAR